MPSDRPTKPHGTFTPASKISRLLGTEHVRQVKRPNCAFGGFACTWDPISERVRVGHYPGDDVTDDNDRRRETEEMLGRYARMLNAHGYRAVHEHGAVYVNPVKGSAMDDPKPTLAEQIAAVALLREYARMAARSGNSTRRAMAKAIHTLDDADLFAALDQERDEIEGQERLTERSRQALLSNTRHVPADPTHDPK